jgi:hypothetical protein
MYSSCILKDSKNEIFWTAFLFLLNFQIFLLSPVYVVNSECTYVDKAQETCYHSFIVIYFNAKVLSFSHGEKNTKCKKTV